MFVVMCESPESVTLSLFWGLFVIMDILLAMILLDIIDIPFRFLRQSLPRLRMLK